MHRRPILLMSLALLFSGCSINPVSPPLVVSGHQPAQLPRERGHLACATALYQTLGRELRLRQRYQSKVLPAQNMRMFLLDGYVREHGARRPARFVCMTERTGRVRVLRLAEIAVAEP